MINTNSTVFKVVSCVASAFVASAVTILAANKLRNGGIFNFVTPVSTDVGAKVGSNEKPADSKKESESKTTAFDKETYKKELAGKTNDERKKLLEDAKAVKENERNDEQNEIIKSVNDDGSMKE